MDRHSFSERRRVLGRVLASSLGRITCLIFVVVVVDYFDCVWIHFVCVKGNKM